MGEKSEVNARVKTREGEDTITGIASDINNHSFTIQSSGFIRPGTRVETLLFFDEPKRLDGKVLWSLARCERENIVYSMGISVDGERLFA